MSDQSENKMLKHVYIETSYSPSGPTLLTDKAISLTDNTKLIVSVFQLEENIYPKDENEAASWDNIPMSNVTYHLYLRELVGDIYSDYKGFKHVYFETLTTNFSRHLIATLLLKDVLKEEHPHYSHYEIDLDVVISERFAHICNSKLICP